jgi:hypothetical protein
MIAGSVNAYREAVIPVSVRDASGQEHDFEAVVDTPSLIRLHRYGRMGWQPVSVGASSQ